MPVVRISGNPDISLENKREMVKKVSEIVAESYGLPIEAITVLIEALERDDIG
ncbi:MAG: tautomerase family protein, partial [Methanobrevibacter sp.]|nr:tautomerase family protein [Methanobrevibacter sp.]